MYIPTFLNILRATTNKQLWATDSPVTPSSIPWTTYSLSELCPEFLKKQKKL